MAKAVKKKSDKEASSLFHNIMAASVSGNPKPVTKAAPKKKVETQKDNQTAISTSSVRRKD